MKKQIMIKVSKNLGVEITIPVHDLLEGGLAVALTESAFDKGFGVSVKNNLTNAQLFSETQGRFILSVKFDDIEKLEKLAFDSSVKFDRLGKVKDDGVLNINGISVKTDEALNIYKNALPELMK